MRWFSLTLLSVLVAVTTASKANGSALLPRAESTKALDVSSTTSKDWAVPTPAPISRAVPSHAPTSSRVSMPTMTTHQQALAGSAVLWIMDTVFRKAFRANKISFPASLGGCIVLFFGLLALEIIKGGSGDAIYKFLEPASFFLAKWLPVFFVPGLAMLPLAPSVGSSLDIAKVLAVVVLGFLYSLSTVSFAVLGLRQAQGAISVKKAVKKKVVSNKRAPPPPKAFLLSTKDILLKLASTSAVVSITATRMDFKYAKPLETVFLSLSSFAAYVWAAYLPAAFNKVVHPLVMCTFLSWGIMILTGKVTDRPFKSVLRSYKCGSLKWSETGAGDILLNLLGPSVISFAISMYSRKKLLKDNLPVVLASMVVSAGGGLFGTAAFVRLISLGGKSGRLVRLSVLARNVTTALAMAVTSILGGDISIAASVVVMTGIIAATYGRSILDTLGVTDPIARGLGIGSAGQGLGAASMVPEPDAFPFAAMSMVLTAIGATVLVSIPPLKEAVIKLAGGGVNLGL